MKLSIFRSLFFSIIVVFLAPSAVFAQWSQDIQLSADTTAGLNENMGQCIAVSGDSVHVVWEDFNVDGGAIFYRHSFDGGATWGPVARLTPSPSYAAFPSIAVSGGTVHVSYRDTTGSSYVSYYLRSLDGGISWETPVSLGNYYWWPSITCDGQMVFVALNSAISGNSEVWFRRSTDNGTTWDTVTQISNSLGRSEDPSIAAGGGYVHLAWNDNRTGVMETWYRRSSDNGVTWGPETQLTNSTVFCYFPILHVNGSNVDLAYGDRQSGDYEIYFRQSTDFGASWPDSTQITNVNGNEAYPNIARDGSNIHLVWWLFNGDAYYRHSGDGGANWDTATVLVPSANTPKNPFIADAGGILHVIWVDSRSGSPVLYYKHSGGGKTSKLGLNLSTLDFAGIDSGSNAKKTFTITNSGAMSIQIDSLAISGSSAFVVDSITAPFSIPAGGNAVVSVSFNPLAAGADNAILTISPSEESPIQVLLEGVSIGKKDTSAGGPAIVMPTNPIVNMLEVTPNPASTSATLKISLSSQLEDVEFSYYDAASRLIESQYVGHLGNGMQSIPLSLPSMEGVSFMRITSGREMIGTVVIAIIR